MSIHVYVLLCIENEEEVVVEEEVASQAEIPPIENNFYFGICGTDPEPPTTQGKP
jgi:predicted TIM-barrel enzyme